MLLLVFLYKSVYFVSFLFFTHCPFSFCYSPFVQTQQFQGQSHPSLPPPQDPSFLSSPNYYPGSSSVSNPPFPSHSNSNSYSTSRFGLEADALTSQPPRRFRPIEQQQQPPPPGPHPQQNSMITQGYPVTGARFHSISGTELDTLSRRPPRRDRPLEQPTRAHPQQKGVITQEDPVTGPRSNSRSGSELNALVSQPPRRHRPFEQQPGARKPQNVMITQNNEGSSLPSTSVTPPRRHTSSLYPMRVNEDKVKAMNEINPTRERPPRRGASTKGFNLQVLNEQDQDQDPALEQCDINAQVKTLQLIQQQYRRHLNPLKSETQKLHQLHSTLTKTDYLTLLEHMDLLKHVYELNAAYTLFLKLKTNVTMDCPDFHSLSMQGGPYLHMWMQWMEYQHDQWSQYPGIKTMMTLQQENKIGYKALFTQFDALLIKTKTLMQEYPQFEKALETMHEITDAISYTLNELQWKDQLHPHIQVIHSYMGRLRCIYFAFKDMTDSDSYKQLEDDSLIWNLQGALMMNVRNRLVSDTYAHPQFQGWDIPSWTFIAPGKQSNWKYDLKFEVSKTC